LNCFKAIDQIRHNALTWAIFHVLHVLGGVKIALREKMASYPSPGSLAGFAFGFGGEKKDLEKREEA
jgi:hypothetical protein